MTRESEVLKILLEMSKEISSQIPIRTVVRRMSMRLRQLLSADECSIMIMMILARNWLFLNRPA